MKESRKVLLPLKDHNRLRLDNCVNIQVGTYVGDKREKWRVLKKTDASVVFRLPRTSILYKEKSISESSVIF